MLSNLSWVFLKFATLRVVHIIIYIGTSNCYLSYLFEADMFVLLVIVLDFRAEVQLSQNSAVLIVILVAQFTMLQKEENC